MRHCYKRIINLSHTSICRVFESWGFIVSVHFRSITTNLIHMYDLSYVCAPCRIEHCVLAAHPLWTHWIKHLAITSLTEELKIFLFHAQISYQGNWHFNFWVLTVSYSHVSNSKRPFISNTNFEVWHCDFQSDHRSLWWYIRINAKPPLCLLWSSTGLAVVQRSRTTEWAPFIFAGLCRLVEFAPRKESCNTQYCYTSPGHNFADMPFQALPLH